MANDYSEAVPKILAMGIKVLRQNAVMPRIVNLDYDAIAKQQQGDTITITLPAAVPSTAVVPGPTPPANGSIAPTKVPLTLSNWQSSSFEMSDKQWKEVDRGIIPMEVSGAVKSLVNDVDNSLFALYPNIYGFYGQETSSAHDDPFEDGTPKALTNANKVLNDQLAPPQDRRFVMNTAAQAQALALRAFQDVSWSGDPGPIIEAEINRRLGFDCFMNQNVPNHTAGTAAAGTITLTSDSDVGDASVTLAIDSGTATLVVGDVVSFANHSQTYAVTANATVTTGGVSVSITPTLQVATDGSGTPVVTDVKPSHAVNLAFQRGAIALASRNILDDPPPGIDRQMMMAVPDPISGLTLRLQVQRQYMQTRWIFDLLWGVALVRPELAARVAGAA
ncbi:MAG: P22 phage major capsid protein family protein [Planctomycetota bacterium]